MTDFIAGHVCQVVYTRNDELMYLMCECSDRPVFTFEYPPSSTVYTNRPTVDEVQAAVVDHYAKLDGD